ncbi:hypothetical protein C8J57DRAFT_1243588 [Mycena rebaudengoi]|nr:hypothetical protein C8J57DRAFT_1243588 [Mycena rebaudengoi]
MLRRGQEVPPPSSPSPRSPIVALTDNVLNVVHRGRNACPDPSPRSSQHSRLRRRSLATEIARRPHAHFHSFDNDAGGPRLAAHNPIIPPIEVLPRASPTLDRCPNAMRSKSTCRRVQSPYPLARRCDEPWQSHRPHLRARASLPWPSPTSSSKSRAVVDSCSPLSFVARDSHILQCPMVSVFIALNPRFGLQRILRMQRAASGVCPRLALGYTKYARLPPISGWVHKKTSFAPIRGGAAFFCAAGPLKKCGSGPIPGKVQVGLKKPSLA